MKTAEEIVAYIETELADAYDQHGQAQGVDAQAALYQLIRAGVLQNLLDGIRGAGDGTSRPGHLEMMLMEGKAPEGEYRKKKVFYVERCLNCTKRAILTKKN